MTTEEQLDRARCALTEIASGELFELSAERKWQAEWALKKIWPNGWQPGRTPPTGHDAGGWIT